MFLKGKSYAATKIMKVTCLNSSYKDDIFPFSNLMEVNSRFNPKKATSRYSSIFYLLYTTQTF